MSTDFRITEEQLEKEIKNFKEECAERNTTIRSSAPTFEVWEFAYNKDHEFLYEDLTDTSPDRHTAESAAWERAQICTTTIDEEPDVFFKEVLVEAVFEVKDEGEDESYIINAAEVMMFVINKEA